MSNFLLLGIILLALLLLWFVTRWVRQQKHIGVRPITGFQFIKRQTGRTVESGLAAQISLGRATLIATKAAVSIAALQILEFLVSKEGNSNVSSTILVGEGTLLPAAETRLRDQSSVDSRSNSPNQIQFVADSNHPFAFASGMVSELERQPASGHLAVGHHGEEIALVGFAAQKNDVGQLVATDDPLGMATGTAVSDEQLIGEDLFAAGAYLSNKPVHIASLLLQDVGRWLIAIIILIGAIVQLLT